LSAQFTNDDSLLFMEWVNRHSYSELCNGSGQWFLPPGLGSYISHNNSCETDVKARIGKAAFVFWKMKKVWRNKHISMHVKLRLCS